MIKMKCVNTTPFSSPASNIQTSSIPSNFASKMIFH